MKRRMVVNGLPRRPSPLIAALCCACLLLAARPGIASSPSQDSAGRTAVRGGAASPPVALGAAERGGVAPSPSPSAAPLARRTYLPVMLRSLREPLFILLGAQNVERGIFLDSGGDRDTAVTSAGTPPGEARRTGNGQPLPAPDGNQVPDYYMQFRVDDAAIFAGMPTTRIAVAVEYLDQGTDSFVLQYDAFSGGPFGDGRFKETARVHKTDTRRFVVATFWLCDANLANRDIGADLRIADDGDGAEIIRSVTVSLQPRGPSTLNVDSYGANPWDAQPDSDAIQACIDRACDGDTVTFTSGVNAPGYQGYRIDKTIFLVATLAKSGLTFTSTDPAQHALLRAQSTLKGFVVRLYARSRVANPGDIDNITLSHLNLDGGMSTRHCFGPDGTADGLGDNWGSWLPECSQPGDPWCNAGTLGMDGAFVGDDPLQDYLGHPASWSTGLLVDDVNISNTECGTALMLSGAASTIRASTIDIAGDHVHGSGCSQTDPDEGIGAWSDGITFFGPKQVITGNLILDASDVGIVFFGGKDTVIDNNTVRARAGNHGMFAGIAVHPWWFGDVSGVRVTGNQVINEGSSSCGGIHAGINIGQHMWGAACVGNPLPVAVGNSDVCKAEPAPPLGRICTPGTNCQEWAYVAPGKTFTLSDNYVSGAHVNYLIEGLDLAGTLVESGNTSGAPRTTDWGASRGCSLGGVTDTWGPIDRVAHHPALAGWVDQRIHCER